VRLAGRGDHQAFEELVRRRQSWIRNLMRHLSGDSMVADDLAQQVFLQTWRKIKQLKQPDRFPGWLKRTAINTWLQHVRRNDPLDFSATIDDAERASHESTGAAIDIDNALAMLPDAVRLCIVLSYHERMSHAEIAEVTALPLGTVKSHIRRGTERLKSSLSDYSDCPSTAVIS
jgi:RNA polymerase sigma-70 factor (ECF subfamily)